jgi:hypothetical protein
MLYFRLFLNDIIDEKRVPHVKHHVSRIIQILNYYNSERPNLEEKVWLHVDVTGGTLWVPACASHPVAGTNRGASPPFTGARSTIGP